MINRERGSKVSNSFFFFFLFNILALWEMLGHNRIAIKLMLLKSILPISTWDYIDFIPDAFQL